MTTAKERQLLLTTLVEAFETYGLTFLKVALGTKEMPDLVKERLRLVKVLDAVIDAAENDR